VAENLIVARQWRVAIPHGIDRRDRRSEPHLPGRHDAEADETDLPLGPQPGQGFDAFGEVDGRVVAAVELTQVDAASAQGSQAQFTVTAERAGLASTGKSSAPRRK